MRKFSVIVITFIFAFICIACSSEKLTWPNDEWLDSSVKYTQGTITQSSSGDGPAANGSASITIDKTSYDDFISYINTLKNDGYEYLDFTDSDLPEALEIGELDSVSWCGSNNNLYIVVMYTNTDTQLYKTYGGNVKIYIYDELPFTVG